MEVNGLLCYPVQDLVLSELFQAQKNYSVLAFLFYTRPTPDSRGHLLTFSLIRKTGCILSTGINCCCLKRGLDVVNQDGMKGRVKR